MGDQDENLGQNAGSDQTGAAAATGGDPAGAEGEPVVSGADIPESPVPAAASDRKWEDFVESLWSDHVRGSVLAGSTQVWNHMQTIKDELIARLKALG